MISPNKIIGIEGTSPLFRKRAEINPCRGRAGLRRENLVGFEGDSGGRGQEELVKGASVCLILSFCVLHAVV